MEQAKEILITRKDTHLDSLAKRLREERVRAVIEPMLTGQELGDVPDDDRQFLVDIGFVRRDPEGGTRDSLPTIAPSWLTPEGELDADRLLDAFLVFWRQHGEPLLKSAPYHEIAPHIVLMAFLDRVANGGGTVTREYAIGSDRMDICLRYGQQMLGMELKVWRDNRANPQKKGLEQLDKYLARLGLDKGWLVIFDRRSSKQSIEERTKTDTGLTPGGRAVTVIRA